MANIIIVDDDPVLLKLYKTRLEKDQHVVQISANGEEAEKDLQKFPANLIVLDLMMPKVNGFKFLENIKKDEKLKSIPVIVFSSLIRPEQEEYLKSQGVRQTINKIDVTPTQLVETINSILGS
ncbi:response regulator [Patescibacteria group bacterium]